MTRAETRCERQTWSRREQDLCASASFVRQRVAPLLPEISSGLNAGDWRAEVIRSKASDRITLRYTFGGNPVVYGKGYFDAAVGRFAYCSLRYLWDQGFASGSGLEVSKPIGFIEESNLLLMRRAEGTSLNELAVAGSFQPALAAVRLAARWLAKFHSMAIPDAEAESPVERIGILNLADALAKAAAECPGYPSLLIGMLHHLESIAPKGASSSPVAPLHGQFRPAHVFLEGSRATVIDIEKVRLSDPAKDVARFVHALKKTCFEWGCNAQRADELAKEFIAEYYRIAPSNLQNLAYFSALLALKAIAKILKSHKVAEDQREAAGELYRLEFERATHGPGWPFAA